SREIFPVLVYVVAKQSFPPADKQPPRAIGPNRQERFIGGRIELHRFEQRIGRGVILDRHWASIRAGGRNRIARSRRLIRRFPCRGKQQNSGSMHGKNKWEEL